MSHYSNPEVPHEVNVSEKTPLRDFARLSLGLCLLAAVVVAAVFFMARLFAPKIPFRYEAALNDTLPQGFAHRVAAPACRIAGEAALQHLAEELALAMALSEEMRLHVHFNDSADPNAFATLGGNIVVQRGLLQHVASENALAMVLAHEIAHIQHRDPIVSIGGGVAVAVLFSALIGNSDGGVLVGWAIGFTQMRFSRDQESAADDAALKALQARYGHTHGADEFFAYILASHPNISRIPTFLSTHPTPPARLETIRKSFSPTPQKLTPLPEALRQLQECGIKPDASLIGAS
ncbi:MAG: M48 family metallopeptidase [Zoogloeaceae bacterium]|jgi:Zn-dependent protease with chaperone function|nr:M48 family metallopeptidase [Zoogloeaceae bacterium]